MLAGSPVGQVAEQCGAWSEKLDRSCAFGKIALGRVWLDLQRVIHLLVGPQVGYRDDSIIDLTHIAQVLARHMSRFVTVFAIPRLINDQRSLCIGSRRRVFAQLLEPFRLGFALIPGGLGEKLLQFLGAAVALPPQALC
jgi:hypothetical protein